MNFSKSKKLDYFDTGIFEALNNKKQALIDQGRKVYNLSIGTPDFLPFEHITKALSEAAADPKNYGYGLVDIPELLDAVSAYYKDRYGVDGILPSEIVSVHGSQYGIGHLGIALCDPDDVVLLPNPGYPI
ncbi:MAG: aminotransferase class I/II-fold pyridoxal phosphate-dependent enzyme, partial [Firmicutes bacterium]|nr:aminotransferase class I/II-fold pyridoxal phosphate-dependent enzyme [Bacillota bacterium]